MGLSHEQQADLEKRLNPIVAHDTPAKPELVVEDRTLGNEEALRGIPVVGRVSGTIKGTRPGDPAHELEREAQDLNDHARRLTQQRMREARARLKRSDG